ncbi:MAG: glucuronate isomerase [Armatimonadetes bacterium]|nr:glucuronate isomerase [Armatimonadota bacterium]
MRTEAEVRAYLGEAVARTPIVDLHTHLYAPCFRDLLLYGVDELVTYHYLIAEVHRADPTLRPAAFYALSKQQQADLIWKTLFVDRLPVSEACRGIITVFGKLGIEPDRDGLDNARAFTAQFTPEQYVDKILGLANVSSVVMTNDPFDEMERPIWVAGGDIDPRFLPALRIDTFLLRFAEVVPKLQLWGYQVAADTSTQTLSEARRFLTDWIDIMQPVYLAASMPPQFPVPSDTLQSWLTEQVIVPVCRERNLPWAVMPGVRRALNPALGQAGDGLATSDLRWIEYLCATYPENRFMITVLARENQHELCIIARKFGNLLPFGCWWFLNNPSLIEEMTRMRFELLGLSHIPQHSDCRILDQLLYKWEHFRPILTRVMGDKLADLVHAGWQPTKAEVDRDVERLLAGNFKAFAGLD